MESGQCNLSLPHLRERGGLYSSLYSVSGKVGRGEGGGGERGWGGCRVGGWGGGGGSTLHYTSTQTRMPRGVEL